jgi:transposase
LRISPEPNPEEVAAIMAALTTTLEDREEPVSAAVKRSRWRLAGLLGHAPPQEMRLEGSLWAYASWEGTV